MRVRTDTLPDMSTALDWSSCPPVSDGLDISGLSSVEDGAPYIQYRLDLTSPDVHTTPEFREISLVYSLDANPPGADSAVASDNVLPGGGIDDDDEVFVFFDEPTNVPQITAAGIDQVLGLSGGHSWTDGTGGIGGAIWNPEGDLLRIQLTTSVSPPTVSVGDTVTLDGTTISDRWGNASSAQVILAGSFEPGTGIDTPPAAGSAPRVFSLSQNYPNPFNPMTEIAYEIPDIGGDEVRIELLIYDARGRVVRRFFEGNKESGRHAITWDGTDDRGSVVKSGVYFYLLRAGDFREVRKMLLVR